MTASKNCGSRPSGCVSEDTSETSLCLPVLPLSEPLFLPTAGQPCWTVKLRAQETPISPCSRELLCSHSQMKVSTHSCVSQSGV